MLLGDFLVRGAKWFSDKTATVFEDTRLTYRELNERANSLSHALRDLGVGSQDRVAVVCHNSHHFMECVFAVAKIGAVAANLNWRLSPKELAALIEDSDAEVILFSKRFEANLEPMKKALSGRYRFIAIGGEMEGMLEYESLIAGYPVDEPQADIDPDDTVLQIYTSGTTGRPKGVMLTHKSFVTHAFNTMVEAHNNGPDKVMLNVLPMFHVAIFSPINNMFLGGTNVFLHGFDFEPFLSCIEKERVNVLALTPVIISFLLSYPELEKYDLSSLELIGYAAAPMPLPLLKKAIETFGCSFSQAFGMTEMSPVMTILTPDQHVTEGPEYKLKRLESVGRPIVNVEVKVVDEGGKECPVGTTGEIIGRGDTMMKGYYKMPEATAEAIRDGWYHTGDMGYFDEYGYLYIVDRKKDLIISGGENIYPKEVEDCIRRMLGVADVAVIGVPDEKWIETVKAILILEPGAELTEEEVIRHCKANLASYKKPTSVEFMAEFPRNPMGKVQKHKLRERFWKGHERRLW